MPERNKNGAPGGPIGPLGRGDAREWRDTCPPGRGEQSGLCGDEKRLEHELGRYQKKVRDDAGEIARLREHLKLAGEGLAQVNRAVDALCIGIALKYGAQVGEDSFEAVLPTPDVVGHLERFELQTRRDELRGEYILRAVRREAER